MSENGSDNKKNKDWVMLLGSNAAVFLTAYFGLAGTKNTNVTEALNICQTTNRELRAELNTSNTERFNLEREILKIEQLFGDKQTQYEHVKNFIDNFPLPMWIKIVEGEPDKEIFRMLAINDKYEQYYKISKNRYENMTDFDVHPIEIASIFRQNDLAVHLSKDDLYTIENIEVDSNTVSLEVYKFSVKFNDGRYGVAGFSRQVKLNKC